MIETATATTTRPNLHRTDGYVPIGDYAAIGDGRTVALVSADGSIDWLCLPELDSPSVFGALLDPATGGSFSLAPAVPYTATRAYLPQSNVLRTEYRTEHGAVQVTEALNVDPSQTTPWRELARRVEAVSGEVPMRWRLHPRFGYGGRSVQPEDRDDVLLWRDGGLLMAFRQWGAGESTRRAEVVEGEFTARAGESALLVLLAAEGPGLPIPHRHEVERRLEVTEGMWREWLAGGTYDGPWKDAVQRSLLAIRLLTHDPDGAIAAAGTTSLPETIGAGRNFDYRFAWVRDLSFTVDALLRVGMRELAHDSVTWLMRAIATTGPRIDPVYTLSGEVLRSQRELPLPGYRGSTPVNLGNQAGSQLQLGGFGDLIETIWRYVDAGNALSADAGARLADSADLLCSIWMREDAGLWELGESAHYATSKIGCWTALHRMIELAERGWVPDRHLERWRTTRDEIHHYVNTELWSEEKQSYVMKAGSEMLDCGVLLAARRGFADPRGERMRGTIRAIRSELHAEGPLFYRYSGMSQQENAFLACSFWMVEALALAGERNEATELMDALVALGNDVGLYSEEMEPHSHELRGNLPQALTHLALISAAAITAGGSAH